MRHLFSHQRTRCVLIIKKCNILVEIMMTIIFSEGAGEIQSYFHDSESTYLYELR